MMGRRIETEKEAMFVVLCSPSTVRFILHSSRERHSEYYL